MFLIKIVDEPIDEISIRTWIGTDGSGAICIFLGRSRDNHDGKKVIKLEYEGYRTMAAQELKKIAAHMLKQWELERVAIVHRLGLVPIGESSVLIAVSAPHRDAAFTACRYGIDQIKVSVPIWKKEFYEGGERWIGSHSC